MFPNRWLILTVFTTLPMTGWAQSGSLFPHAGETRAPLIALRPGAPAAQTASLFAGPDRGSLFAPAPLRPAGPDAGPLAGSTPAARLRNLIAEAEAGRAGYDAVQHGARVRPPMPPTAMTVQQIYDWIAVTPGQPHAIGRYQFIPDTLRRLVRDVGVSRSARFTPALQDRLADQLLAEAGLLAFQRGELSRRSFMYRLAKIWAGLPLPSGRSYYEGHAGNTATMTWARFDGAMARIFPG